MDLKEAVRRINACPTVLVRLRYGDRAHPEEVFARPAEYDEASGMARVFLYVGPLAPDSRPQMRARAGGGEIVVSDTLREGEYLSVEPFETELDVTSLRELPTWAKELWVRGREMFPPRDEADAAKSSRMVAMMRVLIKREREGEGFDPRDMSSEMQGRYLRLWNSSGVIGRLTEGKLREEDLRKLLLHLKTVREALPLMNDLPWWKGGILDPEDRFDWQGAYEELVLLLVQATKSLEDLIGRMMAEREERGDV